MHSDCILLHYCEYKHAEVLFHLSLKFIKCVKVVNILKMSLAELYITSFIQSLLSVTNQITFFFLSAGFNFYCCCCYYYYYYYFCLIFSKIPELQVMNSNK